MTRLSASEAREKWSEILNDVAFRGERVVITRHGRDAVVVTSARKCNAETTPMGRARRPYRRDFA